MEKETFLAIIMDVKSKKGKVVLTDEQLLFLTLDEISRTSTHEEKKYSLRNNSHE
jgi:hypothetical protein